MGSRCESPLRESGSSKYATETLPKKTDNVEVQGESSHDDSEETRLILTEDSTWGLENCPKSYLNNRRDQTAQSK